MCYLFAKVCLCVLQPKKKLNDMKKLIVLAVIFQMSTSCGENTRATTNQKNVRLDSFENVRYNAHEEVKKDSLEIAKVI